MMSWSLISLCILRGHGNDVMVFVHLGAMVTMALCTCRGHELHVNMFPLSLMSNVLDVIPGVHLCAENKFIHVLPV